MSKQTRRRLIFSMLYVLAGMAAIWLFQTFFYRPMVVRETQVPYSTFLTDLDAGTIENVSLTPGRIYYKHLASEENGPEMYDEQYEVRDISR